MTSKDGSGTVNRFDESNLPVEARLLRPHYAQPVDPYESSFQSGFDRNTIIEYVYAVLYRKWIVAAIFAVSVSLAGLYAYTATPSYRSSATIEIEKVFASSSNLNELFSFFGQFDLFYQTQIESLKSRSLAEHFLKLMEQSNSTKKDSTKDAAFSEGKQDKPGSSGGDREAQKRLAVAADSVISSVTVTPVKGTQLIQVDMNADDPALAKRMLENYLEAFIYESRRKRTEVSAKVREWLHKELAETERQLKESEANLLEFSKSHGVVFLDKNPNQSMTALQRAGEAVYQSKDSRRNIEALKDDKEKVLPPQMTNEYLQSLKSQLAGLRSEYTGMKAIYSPDYFKMELLRNKIRSLEEAISEIEKSTLDSALESAKKKEAMSTEAYEKSKEEAMSLSALTVQYDILKKMVDANSQLYVMLLQRSKQAELDNGIMGHNVLVTNPPSLPLAPVYPIKSKIVLIGALLGLFGGIGAAIFLEIFDRSVHSSKEIERRLNIPILGEVPRVGPKDYEEDNEPRTSAVEFLAHKFPTSPFTDSIRIVQNSVSSFIPGETGVVMCVSSALPLEGKTLISVVMGTVIASELKRVLIIDGDLRRPRIHEVFESKNEVPGLSDLITGKCVDVKEAIHRSQVPGVFYMTSGAHAENPVALLKTERMQYIVDECKKAFDFVILDAPPILGLVDASIISGYADGLILVTRSGHTPLDILVQAKESVFRGRGRLLGLVINMAENKSSGSKYYYNARYNRYYHNKQSA
jgi:polysaccharide biosynthesis transport protein